MQLEITGHHFSISDRIREYVAENTGKLEKFYTPILGCHVTITQEGRSFRVHMTAHVHGQSLVSRYEADKVYVALDAATDRMVRQLKKLHDKRRKPRGIQVADAEAAADDEE